MSNFIKTSCILCVLILSACMPKMADNFIIDIKTQVSEKDTQSSTSNLKLDIDTTNIKAISFKVKAKANADQAPDEDRYPITELESSASSVTLPIYGLYENYKNTISVSLHFSDDSVYTFPVKVTTPEYQDPETIADNFTIDTTSQVSEKDTQSSVFISSLKLNIATENIEAISFEIQAKANAKAAAIEARYPMAELEANASSVTLPIYGLYHNYKNTVNVSLHFSDDSKYTFPVNVSAAEYKDPNNVWTNPNISTPASNSNLPSLSYFYLKSTQDGAVVFDIDGEVRWLANASFNSKSTDFSSDRFSSFLNDKIVHHYLTGEVTSFDITVPNYSNMKLHHSLSKGKFENSFLVEIDTDEAGNSKRLIESVLLEVDEKGKLLKKWDFGKIIRSYMQAQGDDPSDFVRDGVDWFHMNSSIYDPSDDSIIASSRENFVIKIDYKSGEIKWLLGDETKHWFVNYPSLQKLSLYSNSVKPMGQHALSLVGKNQVMLFNNGFKSLNQPDNAPVGLNLTSSPASIYNIDPEQQTAELVWSYDSNTYSPICSSIYKDDKSSGDYLINYASYNHLDDKKNVIIAIEVVNQAAQRLVKIGFQMNYTKGCAGGWNADIIGLENIQP